ncbi:hypothetical protein [Aquisalimonas asiatica]|uniref:Cofactor-independent phosphoglycerate mutase n=1 Tax=Aquisalimonas asiatica TaxID=406100 RepID=A0A1H8QHH2_9GAMM|nr:hypothetical protein [Aquisalimonas asiatica]SEO53685.1 hypothetical protein SAMN04488052_101590 [Aquisalimonas asiatica]
MAESVLCFRLPGLLGPLPADAVGLIASDERLEQLAGLLSRGRRHRSGGAPPLVAPGFTLAPSSESPPIGPLSFLGDGGEPGAAYWLRADPVQLVADRDQVRLLGPETLALRMDEAERLARDFNAFFGGDGVELHVRAATRWYLRCSDVPAIETTPLPHVSGGAVAAALPTGQDAAAWRARLNEIQMFLHGHPVNQERETQGLPPVNGIWPWGGGHLPDVSGRWARVFSDDPSVAGLGRRAGAIVSGWPEDPDEVLRPGRGDTLVAGAMPAVSDGETFAEWEQAVLGVASRWVPALETALRSGAYDVVQIDAGAAGVWRIRRRDRLAFWRRSRSLARLLLTE